MSFQSYQNVRVQIKVVNRDEGFCAVECSSLRNVDVRELVVLNGWKAKDA